MSKKLHNSNKVTVVTRDFNYEILKYEKTSIISEFLNLMYSNFLQPCILEPTRIVANNRPSLIDNIFINTIDKKIDSGNIIDKKQTVSTIIKESFRQGVFPDNLKVGMVYPTHKGDREMYAQTIDPYRLHAQLIFLFEIQIDGHTLFYIY